MTTAHRPTWAPAKGNSEQGGARLFGSSRAVSGKNMTSHTSMKSRMDGQASARDLEKRDLKLELEEKEKKHFTSKTGAGDPGRLAIDGNKKDPVLIPKAIDADDSDEEDESDDDDDDDDDTAALLAELDRIKKERAEESARKDQQRAQAEQLEKQQQAARGNPLLELDPLGRPIDPTDFNMKRRWDDDVVFKNQARDEPQMKKRFINDTIRSDFHKRFLNRYIK